MIPTKYFSHYSLISIFFIIIISGCNSGTSTTDPADVSNADSDTQNTVDQAAPSQPSGVTAVNISSTSITLTWAASTDNVATTGYRIFRDNVSIGTTSTLQYVDQGLTANTLYQYEIAAYDAAANESDRSEAVMVSTSSVSTDQTPPSKPDGVTAVNISSTSITLTWAASTDNVATTGYRVFRDNVSIGTTSTLQYVDQGLSPNTQYQYEIAAYDAAANESNRSDVVVVSTAQVVSGNCGAQTGSAVAIPFRFVTPSNIGKYITLAATSSLIEFNVHSYQDVPNINWSRRYKSYKYGNGGGAIDIWRLDTVPVNGTLYEAGTELAANDTISDPDDLFYVPGENFTGTDTFKYCVVDATGQSNVATVTLVVADTANYPMPIGIPNPGFGIDETPPADPAAWPSAEATGYYYVDSDHPSCSDSNNMGYPDMPRCTIPHDAVIIAGGKMVLAPSAQPYPLRNSGWHRINFSGTPANPSWLVGDEKGPDKPRIIINPNRTSGQLRITGGNYRLSGLVFDGVMPRHMDDGQDNIVLRHMEIKNNPATTGSSVGLSTDGNNLLVFNVYSHDTGVVEAGGLSVERDVHGFVGSNQAGFWLLDIRCDENAGDCVQLTNNNSTSDVYVGRMVAHSEGENCIDIKDFNRVVVSESDCWDIRRVAYGNSGGNSQNFYVNDEGVQQNYVYFINNRSWDTGGINFGASNIGGRVYFIGNLSFFSPAADGLNMGGGGGSRYAYFNTFSDSKRGIYHYGAGTALDRYIAANVVDGASEYQTRLQSSTSVINLLDYIFYTDTAGTFASGGSTPNVYNGLADFQAAFTGFSQNSAEGVTAGFVNKNIYDFRLAPGAALIDSVPGSFMSSQPLFIDLSNDLGITTLTDINGTARPQGAGYDAGAFSNIP